MTLQVGRLSAVVALLALAVVPASATTVRHVDTRGLVESSQEIVIGRVAQVRAAWNEKHTKIYTEVEIEVDSSLKGEAARRLTLRQLGGEVDGVRYTVPGCATFRPGEEALLFVWRDRTGRAQVNALAQGKFDISRDAATGRRVVQRSEAGLAFRDVKSLQRAAEGMPAPRIELDEMVAEIERLVAEGRK